MHKLSCCLGEVPYCFSRSSAIYFKVTRLKNRRIWLKLGVSGLWVQFEFTNGFEMMHKAWSSIEEVLSWFWMSSVKLERHSTKKIVDVDPNWAFSGRNSSLNASMATKWYTKLIVAYKICPIVFQCHPSNFKVTQLKKTVNFDPNWAFPDCNSSLNSPMATKW